MIHVVGEALDSTRTSNGAVIQPHPGGGSLALALDPPGETIEALGLRAARRYSLVVDPNVRPSLIADRDNAGLLAWLSNAGCVGADRIEKLGEDEHQSAVAYAPRPERLSAHEPPLGRRAPTTSGGWSKKPRTSSPSEGRRDGCDRIRRRHEDLR